MPYLGNEPAAAYTSTTKDSFSGDGSTTAFTMSKTAEVNAVRVVVENVIQDPTVAYTCSGTTLTFTSAPPSGTNNIYVVHLGPPAATVAPPTTINNTTTFGDGADIITASKGINNVRLGENAGASIASGGNNNTTIGYNAGNSITTGDKNVAVGVGSGQAITTGSNNTAIGYEALKAEDGDSNTVAVGYQALLTQNAGSDVGNTAVGTQAGTALTTGSLNTFVGRKAGAAVTTHSNNVAIGAYAMDAGIGDHNIAIGSGALGGSSLASGDNVAIGTDTLNNLTSGTENVVIGRDAGKALTTGSNNVVLGNDALVTEDGHGKNVAIGWSTLKNLDTGATGLDGENVAVGYDAGRNTNLGVYNTFVGSQAGQANTAGDNNTFIGRGSGSVVTTGDNNTIIGRFNGNEGSGSSIALDIRTADNRVVLSDGGGNPRCHWGNTGQMNQHNNASSTFCASFKNNHSSGYGLESNMAAGQHIYFYRSGSGTGTITDNGSNVTYGTSSDYRLKENVTDLTGAINRVNNLQPKRFNFIGNTDLGTVDGFLAHEAQTVVPEAVTGTHNQTEAIGDVTDGDGNTVETGVIEPDTLDEGHTWTQSGTRPVYQGIDHGKLVPLLTAALQEALVKIETLETKVAALEAE